MKYKTEKNPIQMVFKTVMNSAYGKTIMKPVEQDTDYKYKYNSDGGQSFEQYVHRNHNQADEEKTLILKHRRTAQ